MSPASKSSQIAEKHADNRIKECDSLSSEDGLQTLMVLSRCPLQTKFELADRHVTLLIGYECLIPEGIDDDRCWSGAC